MNTIDGEVTGGTFHAHGLSLPGNGLPDGPVALGIRPEKLVLHREASGASVPFDLEVVELVEPETLLFVRHGSVPLVVRVLQETSDLQPGTRVHLEFPHEHCHWFDAASGERRFA